MLNYWRDVHGDGGDPREISYRAMSPVYAGETYNIHTEGVNRTEHGRTWDVLADKNGVVCMKGHIVG
jgi:hydroxyacyl-ACP dehydratase HTD2-like protein with hotdog domain